jgi:hypothetical protein
VRPGTGRGRQGPGLLGSSVLGVPQPRPAPPAGAEAAAALPEQQRADARQGRWLPRHQPWNAVAIGRSGRAVDDLSARLDELEELRRAGLLTDAESAVQRAWLLGT